MLSVETRQKYMKELGLYEGDVDNDWGPLCKKGTLKMQQAHFERKSDQDGKYGPDTDKLLQNLWNCRDLKYFKLSEFRCNCGKCTGYPAVMNRQLLLNMEDLRKKNGSITITSGLRCKAKNSSLSGSSSNSRHLQGKAVDFYNSKLTATTAKRNATVKKWYSYKKARYAYANTPGMGNAVHVDVK